ncbi:hypothetical protein V500_02416 [Pseudogymnoascus sp. VKM F-4518 (FW-2643)]|nr:hypothetical protein V500_02416 [Pseudogymnoascus sp. VKM F-4518 (FW-2643)]
MQYTFVKACLLALAATSSVFAQTNGFDVLIAPAKDEVVKAGSTFTIKWAPTAPAGPISLVLMQGASNTTLQLAEGFLAKAIDSTEGQYDWAVPADASFAAYGIKLQVDADNSVFQYSNAFTISGDAAGGAGGATDKGIPHFF